MKRLRLILAALLTLALTVGMFAALGGDKAQAAEKAANGQDVSLTTESGLQLRFRTDAADSWAIVVGYVGKNPEVVIPAYIGQHRVYEIASRAFEGNKTIKSVELPYVLRNVSYYAFKDCTSLEKVTFGDYFKFIEEQNGKVAVTDSPTAFEPGVFDGCTALEEVVFPYGVEYFCRDKKEGMFEGAGVKKVTVCWTYYTSIGHMFKGADKLESVTIKRRDDGKYFRWVIIHTDLMINIPALKEINLYDCDEIILGNNSAFYTDKNGKFVETFAGCPNLKNINLYYDRTDETGRYIGFYDDSSNKIHYEPRINILSSAADGSEEKLGKTYTAVSSDPSVVKVTSDGKGNKFEILDAGKTVISQPKVPFTITVTVGGGASNKKNIADCKLTVPDKDLTVTGSEIVPYLYLQDGKTLLEEDKDYTVTVADNKEVGAAKITITGIGDYTGSITDTFSIIPTGTSLKKVKIGKKSSTVVINENKTADGYQIYYSSKKAKGYKKLYSGKDLKASVSSLKSGQYIKVRTYKKVGKTTYYSEWSAPVQVK